jgi:hypothetical protein
MEAPGPLRCPSCGHGNPPAGASAPTAAAASAAPDEARTVLAEIRNSLTEGFDAVDLKEAKALLGELG